MRALTVGLAGVGLPLAWAWSRAQGTDRGFLPVVGIFAVAIVAVWPAPVVAARLVAVGWLRLLVFVASTGLELWRNPGPWEAVFSPVPHLLVVGLALPGLAAVAVAWRQRAPGGWLSTVVVVMLVLAPWIVLRGWTGWPCVMSARSCGDWARALTPGPFDRLPRAVILRRFDPDAPAVLLELANAADDPQLVDDTLGAACRSTTVREAKRCRMVGQFHAARGDLPRALPWWDLACAAPQTPWNGTDEYLPSTPCDVSDHLSLFVTEGALDAYERYFRVRTCSTPNSCRAGEQRFALIAVAQDQAWADRTFERRCAEASGRWCFLRGLIELRTQRGDGKAWFQRACDLGDEEGCRWAKR